MPESDRAGALPPAAEPAAHPDRESVPALNPDGIRRLRVHLLDFFDARARDLPWRETDDPYAIWVSEIMLQQTRVETVVPYWTAWMDAFPTVDDLALADEETVLKAWEGLGYYSRARNLHRASRMVRERWEGRVPDTRDRLRTLPGVGAYTAGAVASIAFEEAVPAVDGNVRRVVARLLDWPDPGGAALEAEVARWVPEGRPGDFNQALMELGATVCTPRAPSCGSCPVAEACGARRAGTVVERPAPRKRAPVPRAHHGVAVAVQRSSEGIRLALRRRPEGVMLAGLWEFPGVEVAEPGEVAAAVAGLVGDGSADGEPLPPVPHAFSHLHVTYHPVLVRVEAGTAAPGDGRWLRPDEVADLPLPVAQRRIAEGARRALGLDQEERR